MNADQGYHYLLQESGWHPFVRDGSQICETASSINIAIDVANLYHQDAIAFGQINGEKYKQQADALIKLVDVVGHLADRCHNYRKKTVMRGGHLFPRIVAAMFRIPDRLGVTVGWLLRITWLEGGPDDEDGDLADLKEAAKNEQIALRTRRRNLDAGLEFLCSEVGTLCLKFKFRVRV